MRKLRRTICFIAPLAIIYILYKYCQLDFKVFDDHLFDLITVSTIFAGFLFSSLSLIMGLGRSSTTIFLERIKEMENIYYHITVGIVCCVMSVLFIIVQFLLGATHEFFFIIGIYLISLVIVFFSLSVLDIRFVIRHIRKEIKKEMPDKSKMPVLDRIKH